MGFLKDLAGPLAGGAINPASGLGMAGGPMSGLGLLKLLGGGGGGGEEAVPAAAPAPNGMAKGLGNLIGADPSRVADIAGSIGKGMNGIAAAGGAQGGYQGVPELPAVNNHMQLLDPKVLQALIQHFGARQ